MNATSRLTLTAGVWRQDSFSASTVFAAPAPTPAIAHRPQAAAHPGPTPVPQAAAQPTDTFVPQS